PVYLCAFAGFVPLARRQTRVAVELALVVMPYTLAAAFFYMWWGGVVSPARLLASILLPLAIPAGVWFAASGPVTSRLGLGGLLDRLDAERRSPADAYQGRTASAAGHRW